MDTNVKMVIRVVLIVAAAADTLTRNAVSDWPSYILVLLVFALNAQLRIALLRHRLLLVSLFLDLPLVGLLYHIGGDLNALLLLVSVFDAIYSFDVEGYIFTAVNGGLYLYYTRGQSVQIRLMGLALYAILATMTVQYRRYSTKIRETEFLYDENRRYSYQLERSKRSLANYSERIEELSQEEERNRISTEIHDTVGHKLTGTLMQLEAALLMVGGDAEKGLDLLESVRENLKESIEILRQTLRKMRPKRSGDRLFALKDLIADFQESTGIGMGFEVRGRQVSLYPSAELTLYKNAREAMTNAARHGKARNITLVLDYDEDTVSLTVSDDGVGCKNLKKGMGLSGMEERAHMLGGRLEVESSDGFTVKTLLPIR